MTSKDLMVRVAAVIVLAASTAHTPGSQAMSTTLFGIDSHTQNLISINPADGSSSVVADLGYAGFTNLTSFGNQLVAVNTVRGELTTIDPYTGMIVSVVDMPTYVFVDGLASIGPALYGFVNKLDRLIRIDPFTGTFQPIGSIDFLNVNSLTSIENTLYGVDIFTDQLISINPNTAASAAVGPTGTVNVQSLAAIDHTLYGVDVFSDLLYKIDPETGIGTAVGNIGFLNVRGLTAMELQPVPVPGALWLLGSGLVVLTGLRRQ